MTDLEMLKLAGRAGGLKWGGDAFYDEYGPICDWSSLRYVGDAIFLVVTLKLSVHINDHSAFVHQDSESIVGDTSASSLVMFSETGGDKHKALRRAITLTAAEIGKRMEEK